MVTPIGWLLLLLGPLLFAWRPRWLYIATIFSLPFTATGIANIGSGPDASPLQASMFFGSLFLLRCALDYLRKGRIPLPSYGRRSLFWLALFVAISTASLAMPLWIDGRIMIPPVNVEDLSDHPLRLSGHNITGLLYLVYGFMLSFVLALINQRSTVLLTTLKAYVSGCVFASLWGLLEFTCKMLGIPYPAVIFNTGTAGFTLGYQQVLTSGIFRVSSVAVEPSILAQCLLIGLAFYMPFVFGRLRLFGRGMDRLCFGLILLVLLLTTSSTAYIGFAVVFLIFFSFLTLRGMLKIRYLVALIVLSLAAVAANFAVPAVHDVLDAALFSKSSGGSAIERLMTITNAYAMFRLYPWLGVGWATVTSHDLIVNLLANCGVIGLAAFCIAVWRIFADLFCSIRSRSRALRLPGLLRIDFGAYIAFAVLLITSIVAGFSYAFGFVWFTCGLAIAASNPMLSSSKARPRTQPSASSKTQPYIPPGHEPGSTANLAL